MSRFFRSDVAKAVIVTAATCVAGVTLGTVASVKFGSARKAADLSARAGLRLDNGSNSDERRDNSHGQYKR